MLASGGHGAEQPSRPAIARDQFSAAIAASELKLTEDEKTKPRCISRRGPTRHQKDRSRDACGYSGLGEISDLPPAALPEGESRRSNYDRVTFCLSTMLPSSVASSYFFRGCLLLSWRHFFFSRRLSWRCPWRPRPWCLIRLRGDSDSSERQLAAHCRSRSRSFVHKRYKTHCADENAADSMRVRKTEKANGVDTEQQANNRFSA